MFARFEIARNHAVSLAGAVVFAALMIAAAVPVTPIA